MPYTGSSISTSNFPFLPHLQKQAKLSMISAFKFSSDLCITEFLPLLKYPEFVNQLGISHSSCLVLEAVTQKRDLTMTALKQKAKQLYSRNSTQSFGMQHSNQSFCKAYRIVGKFGGH